MHPFHDRLALHTWTLDTTPLADVLRIAREAGWNAIELRRVDFKRCFDKGMSNADVLELVRASGLAVACVGVEYGFLFSQGEELKRLFGVFAECCANAVALGCGMLMSAGGPTEGTLAQGGANLRAAGDIAQAHGLKLAIEFSRAHKVLNTLEAARELIARAGHPSCGLLLDAYHLERGGRSGRGFEEVPPEEIFAFQYSDVPAAPLQPGRPTDRLPPGKGVVRWRELLGLLREKGYRGYLSYEAPNPAQWSRPALEVAREGVTATRALLAEIDAAPRASN
ncbi:MAG TPA: sugar phosphate isomerase/epimerase [Burkholderiales bacterium]|nr:sugar phosphate isomerase/epimerase [Burkholderiales bacterium]